MSATQPVSEGDVSTSLAVPDPKRNPSYPARIHLGERADLRATLESWKAKVADAGIQLATVVDGGKISRYEYLRAQMLGSIDQLADCVRRMPGEVGDLYAEDKHRMEQAVAALERLFDRWAKV